MHRQQEQNVGSLVNFAVNGDLSSQRRSIPFAMKLSLFQALVLQHDCRS
jgi:hypothetical protein